MRNYSMSEREAFSRIRPRNDVSKRQLIGILAFLAIGIVGAGSLVFTRYKIQQHREQTWNSAIATIVDVRPKLLERFNGPTGGGMLYGAEVLAKYSVSGAAQERWILVDNPPATLDWVNFQKRMWVGKTYVIRWKPLHPDQIEIEILSPS